MVEYNVPEDLLMKYVCTMFMKSMGGAIYPKLFVVADKCRQEIHDRILQHVGTTRDDKKFNMWLAQRIEDIYEDITKRAA